MNLIDNYNSANPNQQSRYKRQQSLGCSKAKQNEKGLPTYLIFMRSKFQQEYPDASIIISSNKVNFRLAYDEQELVLSMLHRQKHYKRFQYYNQVIINEKSQSIITKGSLLLNNQLVKINNHHQIIMALRKINNINPLISPLKINVNPINGAIQIMNCSYVDSQFKLFNNSQKNIEYFTQRISFITRMILDEITLLFYILEEESFVGLYNGRFKSSISQGENILSRLKESLYRTSIDFPSSSQVKLDYHSKRQKMNKCLQSFTQQINNIIRVYDKDPDQVQQHKSNQINQLANYQYKEPEFVSMFSTQIEKILKFSIYTPIKFSSKKIDWIYLSSGGFAQIEYANARFQLLDHDVYYYYDSRKKIETEQERTYHSRDQKGHYIQTKIIRKKQIDFNPNIQRIEREKSILRKLKGKTHPNVQTYFQSQTSFDRQYIYALYEENNSLESLLNKCTQMSFYQKILMIQQAAKGLLFLHKCRIIHLDFKLANLIVGKKFLVKICDFGQSYFNSNPLALKNHKFGNSFPYAAGEGYGAAKKISQKNDIYSLGVVIYKCLFSEHIWGAKINKSDFIAQLKNKGAVTPKLIPQKYRQYSCLEIVRIIVYLCLRCIRKQPETRPSLFWIVTVIQQIRKCLQLMYYK